MSDLRLSPFPSLGLPGLLTNILAAVSLSSLVFVSSAQVHAEELSGSCGTAQNGQRSQVCGNAFPFAYQVNSWPVSGRVNVRLTSLRRNCSPLQLRVVTAQNQVFTTNFLQPGQSQVLSLPAIRTGSHTVLVSATGQTGVCNGGFLRTWGAEITRL